MAKCHDPVFNSISNNDSMRVCQGIESKELAEVVSCMEKILERAIKVVELVNKVNLNPLKVVARLNTLPKSRGKVEFCLNAMKAMLKYCTDFVRSSSIVLVVKSSMVGVGQEERHL